MNRAFTLIELLVVVAIIVVLLAVLMPAMDGAIYRAELVRCAAQQKTIGTMFELYAVDHKRSYPTNVERRQSQAWATPDFLGCESESTRDLRPVIWPRYLSRLEMFLDPLCGGIGVGFEENNSETRVWGNYLIFAGWNYPRMIGEVAGGGMFRSGDAMEFQDFEANAVMRSRTLLMDYHVSSFVGWPPPKAFASHPSRTQELRFKSRMNQDVDDVNPRDVNSNLGVLPSAGAPGVGTQLTYSLWLGGDNATLDINTTGTDLSVQRFQDVKRWDPRLRPAQLQADYTKDQSVHIYLPE